MKKLKMCVIIGCFFILSMMQVYANTKSNSKINIFPTSKGMVGMVLGTKVNIRKYPNIGAPVIKQIGSSEVRVIGKNRDWYKIRLPLGDGWIYKKYVDVDCEELIPYSKVIGEEIVDYGKQFIGTPYIWGGNNLTKGVDCSGFTQQVYKTFNISMSRVSYMQAKEGKTIAKSQLMPGDLIFFDTSGINRGNISHVGIYVGQDKFLHADATRGVMISSLNSNYYRRNYVKSIRVIDI